MNKVISFFRDGSPLKLIAISIGISIISYFIEKPLPSIFLGLRIISFILFVYGVTRLFKKK